MGKVLVIGCGGVASVAIQKCAMNSEVFDEICIASRTVSKCDALKEKLKGKSKAKITTAQVDADKVTDLVELIRKVQPDVVLNLALPYQDLAIMDACLEARLKVPADVSVIGCDNTVFSGFRTISLTTIDHFVSLKGRDACEIILKKIDSQKKYQNGGEPVSIYHVEYEPKLIIRTSTSYARISHPKTKK